MDVNWNKMAELIECRKASEKRMTELLTEMYEKRLDSLKNTEVNTSEPTIKMPENLLANFNQLVEQEARINTKYEDISNVLDFIRKKEKCPVSQITDKKM